MISLTALHDGCSSAPRPAVDVAGQRPAGARHCAGLPKATADRNDCDPGLWPGPDATGAETCRRRLDAGRPIAPAEGNMAVGYRAAKRLLDIVGALALLVLLAPLMLGVLLVLCATTGGRPLFIQRRLGYRGRRFAMLKFRTMREDAEAVLAAVPNEKDGPIFKNRRDPRITRLGAVLRKTSLDETPQLFNVLAGHMSLVGPRPPIESEVLAYRLWQRRRLGVKPGLTCLWQLSGRSEVGFEDWVRMDLWYVRQQSLPTDLKLLLRTPWSVLRGEGAY